jgi:amino acid transporter
MLFIHAGFMIAGFCLMAVGIITAMFMRGRSWWLRVHRRCETVALICVFLGLATALFMVSRHGGPHFSIPHAWLGLAAGIAAACTYLIGRLQMKTGGARMRPLHRWAGRLTGAMLLLNLLSGLSLVGILPL